MKTFAILFAVILAVSSKPRTLEDLIEEINNSQDSWKAAPNHISAKGLLEVKKLLGAKRSEDRSGYPIRTFADYSIDKNKIPKKFDARHKWPECSSILSIKDESDCGSDWAVAAASAMADRLCIASKGKVNVNISAQHLVSCCTACGSGCDGGYPEKAWDYFRDTGLPTGGDYESEGCQPYEIAPCSIDPEQHHRPCPAVPPPTPPCHANKCTNEKYKTKFAKDKHYGKSSYFIDGEKAMQAEILKNGPIVASFDLYEDLVPYNLGVYQYTSGSYLGGHVVRVLGWGTEGRKKYWLVANSWNRFWGDNGLFKIIRGINDCNFESYVNAGIVDPK